MRAERDGVIASNWTNPTPTPKSGPSECGQAARVADSPSPVGAPKGTCKSNPGVGGGDGYSLINPLPHARRGRDGEVQGRGVRAPAAYLEAAGAGLARCEVAEGVPLQLDLHVAGHPGQLSRAEAAHGGQLQPQGVGETHSFAGIGAAAARRPGTAASGGCGASPAAPTRDVSARSGPEARPALAWLLLRLLLEAGPQAAVVGALSQRGDEAQVAGDVGAGGPLSRHGIPRPGRARPQRRLSDLAPNGPLACVHAEAAGPLQPPLAVAYSPCYHLQDPPPPVVLLCLGDYLSFPLAVSFHGLGRSPLVSC